MAIGRGHVVRIGTAAVLAVGGAAGLAVAISGGSGTDLEVVAPSTSSTSSTSTTPIAIAPTTRPAPTTSTSTTLPSPPATEPPTTEPATTAPPPPATVPPPPTTAPPPPTTRPEPVDWRAVVPGAPPGGTASARDITSDVYVVDISYPTAEWGTLVEPVRSAFESNGWLATPQPGDAGTAIVVVRDGLRGQVTIGPRDGGTLVVYDLRRDVVP